jgi:hypothetical protein
MFVLDWSPNFSVLKIVKCFIISKWQSPPRAQEAKQTRQNPTSGRQKPAPGYPGDTQNPKKTTNGEVPGLDADKNAKNIAICPYVADKKPIFGKQCRLNSRVVGYKPTFLIKFADP